MSSIVPELVQIHPFFSSLLKILICFLLRRHATKHVYKQSNPGLFLWKFYLLFSVMIIWNYKYLVSPSVFFSLLSSYFQKPKGKETQFVFITVYRLFERQKTDLVHNVTVKCWRKKYCLFCCITYNHCMRISKMWKKKVK